MTFNVNNLISSINKSGIAKNSHFEVQLQGHGSSGEERDLMFRADTAEIPGRNLATAEHRFTNYGPINKVPYGAQIYSDITISFLLSADMREKEYFELWQEKIVNTGAFEQGVEARTFSPFNTKYFNDYAGGVIVRQYGSSGELRSVYTLNEAYPINIAPVALSWGDDTPSKMSVTFAYRNYRVAFTIGDQPRRGIGFGFSIGPGGVAGNVNLPGVGSVAGIFGGIDAVQATVGSVNSRVAQIRSLL